MFTNIIWDTKANLIFFQCVCMWYCRFFVDLQYHWSTVLLQIFSRYIDRVIKHMFLSNWFTLLVVQRKSPLFIQFNLFKLDQANRWRIATIPVFKYDLCENIQSHCVLNINYTLPPYNLNQLKCRNSHVSITSVPSLTYTWRFFSQKPSHFPKLFNFKRYVLK